MFCQSAILTVLFCSVGSCTVENILPHYRKTCDNRQFCFVYAHTDPDPCPDISKYLEIVYTCEQKGGLFFLQFKIKCKTSIVLSWSTITDSWGIVLLVCSQCACTAWVSRMGTSQTRSSLPPPPLPASPPAKPAWMEIPAGGLQAVCANPVATHT